MSFERIVALRGIDALDGNMGDMTIRTDAATAERLRRVAEAAGLSLDEVAMQAILERIEEMEDALVAWARLRELEGGSAEAVPHEHVMRKLSLAD